MKWDKGDDNLDDLRSVYQDSNPLETSRDQDSLVRFSERVTWGIVSTSL